MSPVTARRRVTPRRDSRWRQGTGRGAAQPPTLFDGSPGEPAGGLGTEHTAADAAPMAAGSGETLDRLVVASWERLMGCAAAPCPLCGGTMEPGAGAPLAAAGGRCRDCGTTLA